MRIFSNIYAIAILSLVFTNVTCKNLKAETAESGSSTTAVATVAAVDSTSETRPAQSPMAPGSERSIAAPQRTGPAPMYRQMQKTYTMIDGITFVSDWNLNPTKEDQKGISFSVITDKEFTITLAPKLNVQAKDLKDYFFIKFGTKEISLYKKSGKKTKKLLTIKQKEQETKRVTRTDGPPMNQKNYWIKVDGTKISFGSDKMTDKDGIGSYEISDKIKDELTVGFNGQALSIIPKINPRKGPDGIRKPRQGEETPDQIRY